ncbi:MAG: hypothetical protein SFX19_10130 [Alphaproteobacteria bacterium]|nr:hypothetical protein [Alphaproteobacteria bacterium]
MAIDEDLDAYTDDFAVDATFGAITGKVILDMPDQLLGGGEVISTDYKIIYKTGLFPGLAYGSAITVDGQSYTVREPRLIDDGKFSEAPLSKV